MQNFSNHQRSKTSSHASAVFISSLHLYFLHWNGETMVFVLSMWVLLVITVDIQWFIRFHITRARFSDLVTNSIQFSKKSLYSRGPKVLVWIVSKALYAFSSLQWILTQYSKTPGIFSEISCHIPRRNSSDLFLEFFKGLTQTFFYSKPAQPFWIVAQISKTALADFYFVHKLFQHFHQIKRMFLPAKL